MLKSLIIQRCEPFSKGFCEKMGIPEMTAREISEIPGRKLRTAFAEYIENEIKIHNSHTDEAQIFEIRVAFNA